MIANAFLLTTDMFEVTTPGAHFINPRCFGEDFATWLVQRLAEKGVFAEKSRRGEPEPIQEDFGWVLMLPYRGHRFTLALGVMDESIGATPAEWRVDISFEKPLNSIRSWFRRPPSAELDQLTNIVGEVLSGEARIRDLTRE